MLHHLILCYINLHKKAKEEQAMYTSNENGTLNNYAILPKMSYAQYPSAEQQCQYALQGAGAVLLVTLLMLTAFAA